MSQGDTLSIGVPADEQEASAYADIMIQSLMFPTIEEFDWIDRFGRDNLRVVRRDGQVAGGLALISMGQWFAGRSVPMTGVSAVGVAPDQRSAGAASFLMKSALQEMRAAGVPLSALYPATQPVYRRAGYELAGVHMRYRLPTSSIDLRDRSLAVRAIEECDRATLETLYAEQASGTSGNLDRSDWSWLRILKPRKGNCYGYLIERDGRAEGYVLFSQERGESFQYHIQLLDMVALTRDAQRRILTLLADHRSACESVAWFGPPTDPMLYLLAEQTFEIDLRIDWMLRIVDVAAALEARAYPSNVHGEVHFDIRDDVLPENNGLFALEVADGVGRVARGGRGEVKIDVRGLATVYSGHLSPRGFQSGGYVDGPSEALNTAAAIFCGPAPWMPDMF